MSYPQTVRARREPPPRRRLPAGAQDGAVESGLGPMIGRAPAMRELFRRLERLARGGGPVLLAGETGTGKLLAARTLHGLGPVPGAPFVALDPDLGPWREPEVPGTTLYLREVGDLPEAGQTALLTLLARAPRGPEGRRGWRLVGSTGRDLSPEVARGSFRRDLYSLLCGAVVTVPSLRERRLDIPFLADSFLAAAGERQGRAATAVSREAMDLLLAHSWEGNVRELKGEIERGLVLAGDGEVIAPRHLSPDLAGRRRATGAGPSLRQRGRELERHWIAQLLAGNGWNVAAAARDLGISRVGLVKKLHALDLTRPTRRGET